MAGMNRYEEYYNSSDQEVERHHGMGVPRQVDGLKCAVQALMPMAYGNVYVINKTVCIVEEHKCIHKKDSLPKYKKIINFFLWKKSLQIYFVRWSHANFATVINKFSHLRKVFLH